MSEDLKTGVIKKDDKQRVVFTTLERLFKPTVMFFELINLSVILQTMINKILQNLINTGEVTLII